MTTPEADTHQQPPRYRQPRPGQEPREAQTPEELRAEIARTRLALADTTEALVERLDVPTRIRTRIRRSPLLHDRVTRVAAAVAVAGAVVAVWALSRRR